MRYAAVLLSSLIVSSLSAEIVSYQAPPEAKLNHSYTVSVSQNDGEWIEIPSYNVMVDRVAGTGHKVVNSSMAYFDMDSTTRVRVISNSRHVETARVRPASRGIGCTVKADTIYFNIDRPELLSVEVNGDIFDNLQLFANPIDRNAPTSKQLKKFRKNKNFIYFGAGYHKLDTLKVTSGQEVYIAGGALVDGVIEIENADGVRLHGRGMVYPYRKMGIAVRNSRNVTVEGVFTTQCAVGGSDSVKVDNVKVMSYYGWGDGFNVFASNNVRYNHIFARTSDDCTTIYATRKGFTGGCRNIITEDAVLWADVAHPFMIGLHGNVENPDTIEDCIYRNIDVLDMQEKQIDYQGVFAIVAGDNNTVRRITFDDIRVDNFRQGKLFDIRIAWNKKYCGAPGMAIEDITFNNIVYNGDRSELSLIIGYDDTRKVNGIHFNNLVINGVKIYDKMPGKPGWYKTADMARFYIGEHVENLTFSE